jgi:hypothetical protein
MCMCGLSTYKKERILHILSYDAYVKFSVAFLYSFHCIVTDSCFEYSMSSQCRFPKSEAKLKASACFFILAIRKSWIALNTQ